MDYIFFDFNGTILDDKKLCLNLLNEMLKMRNHEMISEEKYLDIFTFPVQDYYIKAGFIFPKDNFTSLAEYFISRYEKESRKCLIFDDVIEVLKDLKTNGKHLYILSASEKNMLIRQLKEYQIFDYFDCILGKDNIYAEGKSEIGIEFINSHQLDKQKCLLIGDTKHDEETAHKMGIKCYLVARGHQSEKVLKKGSSRIFHSLKSIKF